MQQENNIQRIPLNNIPVTTGQEEYLAIYCEYKASNDNTVKRWFSPFVWVKDSNKRLWPDDVIKIVKEYLPENIEFVYGPVITDDLLISTKNGVGVLDTEYTMNISNRFWVVIADGYDETGQRHILESRTFDKLKQEYPPINQKSITDLLKQKYPNMDELKFTKPPCITTDVICTSACNEVEI